MTIKDPLLGKFEILWDDTFTVIENGIAIDKITKEEKPKQTVCGYYSTLEGALRKCCTMLVEDSFEVATIDEVIQRFETLWLDIKNTIKI